MIEDYLKFALDGIRHRRLRAWLTMIGIFIGIFAVVALISLGQGLQAYIDEQFKKVGGNRILVSPGGGFLSSGTPAADLSTSKLTQKDLDVIKKVRGVDNAVGFMVGGVETTFKDKHALLPAIASPTDKDSVAFIEEIDFFKIARGRFLREKDNYKVIIGSETHSKFNDEIKVGSKLIIEGKEFEVVGITKKGGNPFHDRRIVIPLEIGKELFGKKENEFSLISVLVKDNFDPGKIAEDIKKKLRRSRGVKEGEEDFSVETAESVIESFKNVLNIVQILLVGIASISLIVGGVGIMNTMYTSVLERTKQIGIMKSIGAKNSDILFIFLVEAGLLGLVGGIIGVTLGMATSYGIEYILEANNIEFVNIYISLELILGTLAFSFGVGCLSGLLPARKAALMNPVDALRYKM